jgi:manganese transport protein
MKFRDLFTKDAHRPKSTAFDFFKFIGPGLLVTVGFIDPGNWASNIAAGSDYGLKLLWMVSLSTIMLIILQHNAAHLGIVTGDCLSESATKHFKPWIKNTVLMTAVLASISTALAEILGGAVALQMLFKIPLRVGSVIILGFVVWMLISNSYKVLERWIIGFVSIIGLCFILELTLVNIDWPMAVQAWVIPSFPNGSALVIMSVLGAVVMPHNLFLHSEIIQSRQWNLQDKAVIEKQLKYEYLDTIFSMSIGWAINSAMILVAASVFYTNTIKITQLEQAYELLTPLLGSGAAVLFALALLFAGISSSVTAGMAGGSIYAGIFAEPYNIKDKHSKTGVLVTLVGATILIFFISDPFMGLVYSQMIFSIQLPITVFTLIFLTSNKEVMGDYVNTTKDKISLWSVGIIVTILNVYLLLSFF